ncbi:divalent-cation tolerance protein CutA [Kordiimonas aquimaris]|uniref:divalent-cation tolerance protein CutA n=1 Tax=Kordiimonas aquimaris TaxID=707591 RepID=UPI0021CEA310|nr:divalent-cation tolerance protein CutA [Kordiimonas aquimaris]
MTETENSEYVTIYSTVENEDAAVHMATSLVRDKLIACANLKSGMRSIYEVDGIIQFESEVMLIMKSQRILVDKVIERIKEMHSYQTPCITVWPIIDGNVDYLSWIKHQTINTH